MPLAASPPAKPRDSRASPSRHAPGIADKVALVTGAARGLGRAMAIALADCGATVFVNDLALDSAEAAAHELHERGGTGEALPFDVSASAAVHLAIDALVGRAGRIDILINNAGIGDFVEFPDITDEKWTRMLDVHLKGAFNCSHAAFPHMVRQRSGKILNVSSVAGKRGDFIGNSHSTAAKAGMIGLTKSLAFYAARHGINVNAIAPGLVATELSGAMRGNAGNDDRAHPGGKARTARRDRGGRALPRLGCGELHLRRDIGSQRRLLHGLARHHERCRFTAK